MPFAFFVVCLWFGTFRLILANNNSSPQSVFRSKHDVRNCLQDEQFVCISLQEVPIDGDFYVTMEDMVSSYRSTILSVANMSNVSRVAHCFLYFNDNEINVRFFEADTNQEITVGTTSPHDDNDSIALEPSRYQINATINATFNVWMGTDQCIEVVAGDMFISDTFVIEMELYRLRALNSSNSSSKIDSVSVSLRNSWPIIASNTPKWYNIICLEGSPLSSNTSYLGVHVTVLSTSTPFKPYALQSINGQIPSISNTFESASYADYDGAVSMDFRFDVGIISMKYWQSCALACNEQFGPCWFPKQHRVLQENFPVYVASIVVLIFVVYVVMMATAFFNYCFKYTCGERPHWKGMSWLLIEACDWWTDVAFVVYLYLHTRYVTDERIPGLYFLFVAALTALSMTYFTNMLYLTHYLQIWAEPKAPGITRLWLQQWSWFLIFATMFFGGIHVALEFCNSLITPQLEVFTMHIPHSEMVRTRKDRFVSNVFFANLPFLVIYTFFWVLYREANDDALSRAPNVTVWLCASSTVLSLALSTFWAFYQRGYAQQHPLALYHVSIYYQTPFWKTYYIHSHDRICRALQRGLKVRKQNLLILDQCSESFQSMKIEARILWDSKVAGYKIPPISNETAQNILDHLRMEFRDEMYQHVPDENVNHNVLNEHGMRVKRFYIEHIDYGRGEYVYNHNTGVLIVCNALKGILCPHTKKHRAHAQKHRTVIEMGIPIEPIENEQK